MPEIVLVRAPSTRAPLVIRAAVAVVGTGALMAFVVGGVTPSAEHADSRIALPLPAEPVVGPDPDGVSQVDPMDVGPSIALISALSTASRNRQPDVSGDVTGGAEPSAAIESLEFAPLPDATPVVVPDGEPERPPEHDHPTEMTRMVVKAVARHAVDTVEALVPAVKPAARRLNETVDRVRRLLPGA